MQIETSIDEADIGRVQVGLPAVFTVDAWAGEEFRGEVTQVRYAPVVNQNVVTYTVVITVANPEKKLFPGMTANVSIEAERRDDVLRLPAAALRFRPKTDEGAAEAGPPRRRPAADLSARSRMASRSRWPCAPASATGRLSSCWKGRCGKADEVIVGQTSPAPEKTAGDAAGSALLMLVGLEEIRRDYAGRRTAGGGSGRGLLLRRPRANSSPSWVRRAAASRPA